MTNTNTNGGNYEARIAQNMAHMNSALTDWTAVEIKGFADTTDDKGQAVKLPEFVFPVGYQSAPSLYKNTNSLSCNCELCGHDIKNVFWIKNDKAQWLLAVGSECVTHFGAGQSGTEISEAKRKELNRELVKRFEATVDLIRFAFSYRASTGYGRTEEGWKLSAARDYVKRSGKIIGKTGVESTDGAISGFITRKGEAATAFLAEVKAWLNMPATLAAAKSNIAYKRNTAQGIVTSQRLNGQPAAPFQIEDAKRRVEWLNEVERQVESY